MSQSLCQKRVRVVVEDANKRPYFRPKYMHGDDFALMRKELAVLSNMYVLALSQAEEYKREAKDHLERQMGYLREIQKSIDRLEEKMDVQMIDAPGLMEEQSELDLKQLEEDEEDKNVLL